MKSRIVLGLAALVLLALVGAWRLAGARTVQLFGTLVHRVETTRPVVALTFDDGPTPLGTDSILAILAEADVRATFFFTGRELAANPELGPRFVAAGHELGNHSYSHVRLLLRSTAFIRREIELTDSLIREAGHTGDIHFRPPYGKKLVGLPRYLAATDRPTLMWDVEPDSDVGRRADLIEAHVLERTRPGSIILLHVMYPSRSESLGAVRGIVAGLRRRGFEFVTVSELLAG